MVHFNNLYPAVDPQGGFGDPFDYIDGPAGGIHDDLSQTRDRNYMRVSCAAHIGYAFLQHLMPWFKYAAGDDEILQFADRIYDGYGIDNFDGGLWMLPDPVAPRDPSDYSNCSPFEYTLGRETNCSNYMINWGILPEGHPDYDENDPKNNYIAHDQDPNTYGRMAHLHGAKINFTRMNSFIGWHWNTLRPCSDPNNALYPCDGLGTAIDNSVLSFEEELVSKEKIIISHVEDKIVFKTLYDYNKIELKIYSITGSEVIKTKGTGNQVRAKDNLMSTGIYIYNIELDGTKYNGKISLMN